MPPRGSRPWARCEDSDAAVREPTEVRRVAVPWNSTDVGLVNAAVPERTRFERHVGSCGGGRSERDTDCDGRQHGRRETLRGRVISSVPWWYLPQPTSVPIALCSAVVIISSASGRRMKPASTAASVDAVKAST